MIEESSRDSSDPWILAPLSALLGAVILFDAHPGINWGVWVAITTAATLYCQRSRDLSSARPAIMLAAAAVLAAGAAMRTTDNQAYFGIFCLTAFLLGAFLSSIYATTAEEVTLPTLLTSPFAAVASVAVSATRKLAAFLQGSSGSSSKTTLRRIVLVAPVVIILIALLGGADPLIHSAIQGIGDWLPQISLPARVIFFLVLFVVTLGAFSRLPELKLPTPFQDSQLRGGPTAADATVLVASTLATLALFLVLQVIYLFVRVPGQSGNGVTYAEYARRGFGELCVVVTIVAAVILFAEKLQRGADARHTGPLKKFEFGTLVAAGLVLLSALRRIALYEQAYGFTVARVHAIAYMVFLAGVLVLLGLELGRARITPSLGRRSAALGLAVVLAILYWNDEAWIMNRNIDRIRTTGKFDAKYAASLSADALPAIALRKNELAAGDWVMLRDRLACKTVSAPDAWYEWNPARSAAHEARTSLQLPQTTACPKRAD